MIAAFVVAIVALMLSWVPIINNGAAFLALVALVLGIVGLVNAARKGRPGKGMAVAAVVISVVSLVVVVTTQIAYGRVLDEFVEELDSASTSQLEGAASADATADAAADEDESAASAVRELAVVESAFGQNTYDPTTWWYVVIVENPNAEHVFPLAGLDVEAIGADGTILDSGSTYVDVLPGRVALTGSFMSVGTGVIDHLDLRGPDVTDALHKPGAGSFTVTDVAAATDEWSTTVGGNLSGSFVDEQSLVKVVVVARNAQGQIIDADFSFVDRLPPGVQARFEVNFMTALPADTTYEVYPAL
ncbi:hypothetical protein KKR89_16390 [Cellulomonas dongxiuzhuiae]|uniref:DUF4190 domain-containing protein n=1 Tax=Cellulomonas dongxiuzhuiae TaxID=2819979 RepID=A0ABX8GHZ4_9CELL|nr:hypothetical protein [Cellulomonas dongxiuzhuiae]QWC15818.1 hypothetical protein KKR89_16390 [Cellulomonas dongxiuzhuiae]